MNKERLSETNKQIYHTSSIYNLLLILADCQKCQRQQREREGTRQEGDVIIIIIIKIVMWEKGCSTNQNKEKKQ